LRLARCVSVRETDANLPDDASDHGVAKVDQRDHHRKA
jgi:hypothetical protein